MRRLQILAALERHPDQPVDTAAGGGGNRQQRHVAHLRQGCLDPVPQRSQHFRGIADEVPLVGCEHERPAFLDRPGRNGEVLALQPVGGVEEQHDHFGESDRAVGVRRRQPLDPVLHAGAAAKACRIHQAHGPALPGPFDGDRIACHTRLRPGQQAFLVEEPVDQRRFAHIRPADNGELERARRLVVLVSSGAGASRKGASAS